TSTDIEEFIEDTLEAHLESGILSIGDPTIILAIRDALLKKAHGMFLWVVFQIDSICSQKTDEAILAALKDLPKDLPDTFNRILRKLQSSNADSRFCEKIFGLLAAAQRPLNLEELCEATSVTPGETTWDASKLVNDMLKSLLDSCGSLVVVDEEHLTVHFAHHSIKQHLLSEPTDSDMKKYHIDMQEADLYLGDITVTYLNFEIFDRQLTMANPAMLPQVVHYPSAVLGSLPRSNFANKWAVRLLKSRGNSGLDIQSQLKNAAGIVGQSKEQTRPAHPFLPYAQKYWLFHTKAFMPNRAGYILWQHLINDETKTVELPWAPNKWDDFEDGYMKWIMQNKHWALIGQSLEKLIKDFPRSSAASLLLEFLEKHATSISSQNVNLDNALNLASFLNNKTIVLLSLGKGANVNAEVGNYGNALRRASFQGHVEITRLLLENGANVNAKGGDYGNALRGDSSQGHVEIARILLENGASVNAEGEFYGTALLAASFQGHVEITRLLLENGANVNAKGGDYGNALRGASSQGHVEITRILLENGASVDAEGGFSGNALIAASEKGYLEIARLLLENGANVNAKGEDSGTALMAASSQGHFEIARLLLENGANVNAGGAYYGSALLAASENDHVKIARLLLENGADVNAQGIGHRSCLEGALRYGSFEIVKLLLHKGAIATDQTMEAASFHSHEVKRLIRKALESQAS
ncbi:hypothetical protein MMC22_008702, partial [Lobaria immixta]|nr:hypothetical protein [Lobaria immixta]